MLLHIFLEGGANKGCKLIIAYYAATSTYLPILVIYLDSTPSYLHFLQLCSALAKSFPSTPVLKQLTTVVIVVMLGLV